MPRQLEIYYDDGPNPFIQKEEGMKDDIEKIYNQMILHKAMKVKEIFEFYTYGSNKNFGANVGIPLHRVVDIKLTVQPEEVDMMDFLNGLVEESTSDDLAGMDLLNSL